MKRYLPFLAAAILFLSSSNKSVAQTIIKFYTTEGNFDVQMYDSLAPKTSGNFIDLVNQKYYDGIIFHRVIDNFMIQGGDPTGTGSGGPGYSIMDEFHSSLSNIQKTISMANSGPNTGGSQFFINLKDNTYLDHDKPPSTSKHAVFGIVTSGFNIVQKIGKVNTNAQDRPVVDVVMDSLRVFDPTTGIALYERNFSEVNVFPNPISGNSKIIIDSEFNQQVTVRIYDQIGREVYSELVLCKNGLNYLENSTDFLRSLLNQNAIYFLNILGENLNTTKKIIIAN